MAKSDIAPEEFYGEFLPRVVSALAAVGGAVWTSNDEGRLALQYQINLQETRLRDKRGEQIRHGRLLHKVLTDGEGMLVPPHSGAGDDDEAANPTDFLLVLGPAQDRPGSGRRASRSSSGPTPGPPPRRDTCGSCMQMCELAGDFFKSHQLRHFSDRQVLWTQLEEFTRGVHASLDPRETAYTIANEGRRLIECDRVSVAIRTGQQVPRSRRSAGRTCSTSDPTPCGCWASWPRPWWPRGEPIWYTGDTSDMAPQVEDAVQEYVDESHSKTVAVLPLDRPGPSRPTRRKSRDDREEPEAPIGALIVEQIEDSRVPQKMLQRVDVVCRAQLHGLGQRHGAPQPVPDARVADAGQGPLGGQGPNVAQDAAVAGAILAVLR